MPNTGLSYDKINTRLRGLLGFQVTQNIADSEVLTYIDQATKACVLENNHLFPFAHVTVQISPNPLSERRKNAPIGYPYEYAKPADALQIIDVRPFAIPEGGLGLTMATKQLSSTPWRKNKAYNYVGISTMTSDGRTSFLPTINYHSNSQVFTNIIDDYVDRGECFYVKISQTLTVTYISTMYFGSYNEHMEHLYITLFACKIAKIVTPILKSEQQYKNILERVDKEEKNVIKVLSDYYRGVSEMNKNRLIPAFPNENF